MSRAACAIAALLLAAACGSRDDGRAGTSAGSAGTKNALFAAVDAACACRDDACRDRARTQWDAAVAQRPAFEDPTTMSGAAVAAELADSVVYDELRKKFHGCVARYRDAAAVTTRIGALADAACACPDAACLEPLRAEQDAAMRDLVGLGVRLSPDEQQAQTIVLRRFRTCEHKLGAAP